MKIFGIIFLIYWIALTVLGVVGKLAFGDNVSWGEVFLTPILFWMQ